MKWESLPEELTTLFIPLVGGGGSLPRKNPTPAPPFRALHLPSPDEQFNPWTPALHPSVLQHASFI